jgi:hypothetical protein
MKTKEGEELSLILLTTPVICEPVNCEFVSDSVRNCKHLQNIELAKPAGDGETIEFDILIGLDHYWDLITGEIIKGLDGPTAVYSKLGWILSGPTITESNVLMTHILTTGVKAAGEKSRLEEQLKSFWELESLGILEHEASLYDQFKNHVTHDGVRYEVTLPWKSNVTSLPDNYELSLSRLKGLLRRLRRDTNLLNEYNSCIKNQIDTDVVEIIDNPSIIDGGKVHYLPHHAVIRQDKLTTKMRIVYDASAKGNGLSLNECLHAGPKFNQQIFELLIRFRLHKHAFIADVEKAFLMISIHKNDRDVLRFLWVKDPHKDPIEIQVLRFKRVAFGITASPFLLNATMRYHIESFKDDKPEIVHKLLRSVYVDDVISGTDSREQSIAIFEQFREMLSLGGFNLRKYISAGDMHLLQSDERGETQKVLGLNWDIRKDELIFDLSYIAKECNTRNPTKRYIVSVTSKIYDPIGFIAPVTLQFKIFLQALHCARIDWDEPIQNELLEHWAELISHIKNAKPIIVPRCYFSIDYKKCQLKLVGFSDSSVKAYGAVIYLWYFDGETTGMTIVASKTRVAPIKSQTIPRLELMGALLLARLITCVYNSLTPELVLLPSVCYIDSQVVLYWIKGEDKEWKPFVYNRVKEIRELVSSCHWKHCAGQRNPADIASRGATVNELVRSELWWNGPVELEEGRKVWVEMPTECTDELRSTTRKECGLLISESSRAHLSNIIDIHCHSTLNKLLVVTAYVLKFVKMLRFFHTHRDQSEEINEIVGFLDQAEILWIKEVQGQLEKNRNFLKWKAQLRLFKDESKIWRCGGRLAHAELPYETKHPVVLPGSHYFTKLVVKRAHERVFHNGVKETLNEIRSRFWILKGRSVVRKLIHQCVVCRKIEGLPYASPEAPPLPAFRVTKAPAFSYTGIDFAGPLYVKNNQYQLGGKIWLCLYTCCITRAIHLDLLYNLSFEFFFRSLKRFIARKGLPRRIITDNAKTFKGAARLIQELMNHPNINHYLSEYKMQWTFNVERAPWWGGIFERMVRSVKRCLKKVVGKAKLSQEELLTLITEVEMIVNSRPLSYITPDDLEEPLTPSHLLIGRRVNNLPDSLCYTDDHINVTPQLLTKRMAYLNRTLDQFWNRWRREYLLELREAHRVYKNYSSTRDWVCIGDIVVIHEDDKRRCLWKIGRVEELITGRDEQIRAAIVRVGSSQGRSKLLNRPVQKLYPIEIYDRSELSDGDSAENTTPILLPIDDTPDEDVSYINELPSVDEVIEDQREDYIPQRKSRRAAAIVARDCIKAQLLS